MSAAVLVPVEEYLNTSYPDGDREYVDGRILERNLGEIDHADLQSRIYRYIANHHSQIWAAVEVRVQVTSNRYRVPDVVIVDGPRPEGRIIVQPPLIVAEVLSRDDRADDLQEKVADYLAFGVPNVWVLNPRLRRAWYHTRDGSQEVHDGILRTTDGRIELPFLELIDSQ